MSCEAFEKLIALDAGGDLTAAEAARAQTHLEACAPCRELARGIGASQAGLQALAQAGLDEDAVAHWRRSLLARIEAEPRRRILGWRWAWAAAAAMALVALLAFPRHRPRSPARAPVAQALPPAPATQDGPPRPPRPAALAAQRRPRQRRAPTPAAEPLLVRFETSDPNVVIYWIVDRKGN